MSTDNITYWQYQIEHCTTLRSCRPLAQFLVLLCDGGAGDAHAQLTLLRLSKSARFWQQIHTIWPQTKQRSGDVLSILLPLLGKDTIDTGLNGILRELDIGARTGIGASYRLPKPQKRSKANASL